MKRRNFLAAMGGALSKNWHLHSLSWTFLAALGFASTMAVSFSGGDKTDIWLRLTFTACCTGMACILRKLDGD